MAPPPRFEVGSSIHCMNANCDRDVSITATLVPMDEPDAGQFGNVAAETVREFAMALGWGGVPFWRCPEHRLSIDDYPQGLVDRCIVELERRVGEVLSEVRLGIGRLEADADALDSNFGGRLDALESKPSATEVARDLSELISAVDARVGAVVVLVEGLTVALGEANRGIRLLTEAQDGDRDRIQKHDARLAALGRAFAP